MRRYFLIFGTIFVWAAITLAVFGLLPYWLTGILLVIYLVGLKDSFQRRHAILRNFPILGHFRYLFEMIRPEIQQYFIESYSDGKPLSKEQRSVVYQRSKKQEDNVPFGTQTDVYAVGAEWIDHSLAPAPRLKEEPRVIIGNERCKQPYHASIFNISAMSFGSLSKNAVMALNRGAKAGGFIQDTGEGSLTQYHLEGGGDLTWQIATGYFGCRTLEGKFDAEKFRAKAILPNIKMIEIKLSQGAKPGHGGILPGSKVSQEIADIRGIRPGVDCISPAAHTAFTNPLEMMNFLQTLRDLSGGKPIGFKLCVGKRSEFFAVCKAMIQTDIYPDFITVDGSEGGTGASPLEFTNSVGTPLIEGLLFVHNTLVAVGIRDKTKIIASGKIINGFDIAAKIALGADLCNSARGMMMAIGCIQALRCNTNSCPTGVATQDAELMKGLVVADKSVRVTNYHRATVASFVDLLSAGGFHHASDLLPKHIYRRMGNADVRRYDEIYHYAKPNSYLNDDIPDDCKSDWLNSSAESFNSK